MEVLQRVAAQMESAGVWEDGRITRSWSSPSCRTASIMPGFRPLSKKLTQYYRAELSRQRCSSIRTSRRTSLASTSKETNQLQQKPSIMRTLTPSGLLTADCARRLLALQASAHPTRAETIGASTPHRLKPTLPPPNGPLQDVAAEAAGGGNCMSQDARSWVAPSTTAGPYDGQHSPLERLGRPAGGPRAHLPPRREPPMHAPSPPLAQPLPQQKQQLSPRRGGVVSAADERHPQQRQQRNEQQHYRQQQQETGTEPKLMPTTQPPPSKHATRSPRCGSPGVGPGAQSDPRDSDGRRPGPVPSHWGPRSPPRPSRSSALGRRQTMTHKPSGSHQQQHYHHHQEQQHYDNRPGQQRQGRLDRGHDRSRMPRTQQQEQPQSRSPHPAPTPQSYTELGGALIHARHCLSRALAAAADQEQLLALLEVGLYPYGEPVSDPYDRWIQTQSQYQHSGRHAQPHSVDGEGAIHSDVAKFERKLKQPELYERSLSEAAGIVHDVADDPNGRRTRGSVAHWPALDRPTGHLNMFTNDDTLQHGDLGSNGNGAVPSAALPLLDPVCVSAAVCSMARLETQRRALAAAEAHATMQGPSTKVRRDGQVRGGVDGSGRRSSFHESMRGDGNEDSGGGWLGQVPGPVVSQERQREWDWGSDRWQLRRRQAAELSAAAAMDAVQVVKAAAARVASEASSVTARSMAFKVAASFLDAAHHDDTAHRLRAVAAPAATAEVVRIGRGLASTAAAKHSPALANGCEVEVVGQVTVAEDVVLVTGRVAAVLPSAAVGSTGGGGGDGGFNLETLSPLATECSAGRVDDEATRDVVKGCCQVAVHVRSAVLQASAAGAGVGDGSAARHVVSDQQVLQSPYTRPLNNDRVEPALAEMTAPMRNAAAAMAPDGTTAGPALHGKLSTQQPSPLPPPSSAPSAAARPSTHNVTQNRFLHLIEVAVRQCLAASGDLAAVGAVHNTNHDASDRADADARHGAAWATANSSGGAIGANSLTSTANAFSRDGSDGRPTPLLSPVVAAIASAAAAAPVLPFRPREAANVVWGLSNLRPTSSRLGASDGAQELLVALVGSLLPPLPLPVVAAMMSAAAAEGSETAAAVESVVAAAGDALSGSDVMTSLAAAESAKSKAAAAAASSDRRRVVRDTDEEVVGARELAISAHSASRSSFGTARSSSKGISSQQKPRWRSGELAMTAWGMAHARVSPPSRDWLLSYLTAWDERTLAAATLPELACLAWALAWWQRLAVQSEMWALHGRVGATRPRAAGAAAVGRASIRLPRAAVVHSPSSSPSPSSRPTQQRRRRLPWQKKTIVPIRELLPASWLEPFWSATVTHFKRALPITHPSSRPGAPPRTSPPYTGLGASELAMLLWSLGTLRLLPPRAWLDVALRCAATMANTAPPLALATTLRGVAQLAALQPVVAVPQPYSDESDVNAAAIHVTCTSAAHDDNNDGPVTPAESGSGSHYSRQPSAIPDGSLLSTTIDDTAPSQPSPPPFNQSSSTFVKTPTPMGTRNRTAQPPPLLSAPESALQYVATPPPARRCPAPAATCRSLPAAFTRMYLGLCVAALESFGPSQVVELLRSLQLLAASGHLPPPTSLPLPLPTLLDTAATRLQRCHHHFLGPRHCLAAATALVQLGHTPPADWVTWWLEEMYGGLHSSRAGALREHELMRVVQALTAFRVVPGATWTAVLLTAFARRVPYMSRTFMTDMLTTLAAAGLRLGGLSPSEHRRQELLPPLPPPPPSRQGVRRQGTDLDTSRNNQAPSAVRGGDDNNGDSRSGYGGSGRTYPNQDSGGGDGGDASGGGGGGGRSEWAWLTRVLREWGSRPSHPEPWCGGGALVGGRRGHLSRQPASREEAKRLLTAVEALAGPPASWPPAPRAALKAALARRGKRVINRNQLRSSSAAAQAPDAATSAAATTNDTTR